MAHRKLLIATLSGGVLLIILWIAPGILMSQNVACPLRMANAQDNPCLTHEATILALQGAIAKYQIDATNAQATIAVLEVHGQDGSSPTPAPLTLPFTETFTDNTTGWEL